MSNSKPIEDDVKRLKRLSELLSEYATYINQRERQPMAGRVIAMVRQWVLDNIDESL